MSPRRIMPEAPPLRGGARPAGSGGGRRAGAAPSPAAVAAVGLLALAVAMGVGRFAFTPILPLMQQETGLSVAAGGWLASANYLGYLLGAVAVPAIATRLRPATGIRGGLLVIAIVTLGMGVADRFAAWIVLRAVAGIGSASVLVFVSAWCLERLAPSGRPVLNGVVFAGVGTGIAIAGGSCLVLKQMGAASAQAWIGLGAASLVATVVTWRVFGAGEAARAHDERGSTTPARRFDGERARLVVCYGAFGFGYIIPGTFLPAMARQAIHDPLVFGWSWPVFGAAAAVSPLLTAMGARRIEPRRLWMLGHLVMAFGVALPVWWPGIIGSILVAALLVGGTFMVITQAGMQEARVVAGPQATRLMAAMTAAFAAGQVAGPVSVSYLAGSDANLSRPLLAASLALLVSAVTLSRSRRQDPATCPPRRARIRE